MSSRGLSEGRMFQNVRITKGSRKTPGWLVFAAGYWLVLENEAAVANGCMVFPPSVKFVRST